MQLKSVFSTCIAMICFYRTLGSAPVTARSRAFSQAAKNVKAGLKAASKQVDAKPIAPPSAVSRTMSFPKDHPFAFQLIIATVKTSAADLVVQTVAEGKQLSEVDWRRNGIFVVFGFAYLGTFQWWLMVNKYRQWFPTMDAFAKMSFADKLKYPAGMLDAAKMVLFDVIVHLPMMYFPTYYTVKEFVGGSSWNPVDWARDGMTKYSKNMKVREHTGKKYFEIRCKEDKLTKTRITIKKEDLTAMIQLWGPSDCVQFVLPVHIRMPFRHIVSFFWTAYVSFTRGSIQAKATPTTD